MAGSRWYPTVTQLSDPAATHRTLKQVLDQFYSLQDQHNALQKAHTELQAKVGAKEAGPPPGSGPTDSQICGLYVAPIDTNALANGATLKFDKANGNFKFS